MTLRTNRAASTVAGALAVLFVAIAGTLGGNAYAQADAPQNSQPNPYRTIENWAKLPEGRTWGAAAGVDVDGHENYGWLSDAALTRAKVQTSHRSSNLIPPANF